MGFIFVLCIFIVSPGSITMIIVNIFIIMLIVAVSIESDCCAVLISTDRSLSGRVRRGERRAFRVNATFLGTQQRSQHGDTKPSTSSAMEAGQSIASRTRRKRVVDKGTREGPEGSRRTGLVVFCTPETLLLNYRPTRGIAWSLVFMIQTVAQERGSKRREKKKW